MDSDTGDFTISWDAFSHQLPFRARYPHPYDYLVLGLRPSNQDLPRDIFRLRRLQHTACFIFVLIAKTLASNRIRVAGGTGFLGAHVVDLLLEQGIAVVVTARSEPKTKDLMERRSRFKDLPEVVVTGDLSAVGAFDDLTKDVDVIIHCASVSFQPFIVVSSRMNRFCGCSIYMDPKRISAPFMTRLNNFRSPPNRIQFVTLIDYNPSPLQPLPSESSSGSTVSKTLIDPATSGTLSILRAARKNPTFKHLVLTSSVAPVLDIVKDPAPGPDGDSYTADDWNPITYEEDARSDRPLVAYTTVDLRYWY